MIFLLSKGLSRVFSSTTVQKHIVCIICIVLSNPLLRSGAPQAPPVLCQHPAESKAINACQTFTPPHCLSPTGDSVAQTLLTYLKNSKLLQLKKKKNTCINMDQMHRSNLRGRKIIKLLNDIVTPGLQTTPPSFEQPRSRSQQ